ncbi:hypothetical protein Agub_g3449 [Astrephomene gubernaculifera]|uniref:Transmembrane protein 19 n=1 Tax=Astrephomene gubernaculifera TaxID=47775 RepID=A0AAD3DKQ4_9CHLO|nr:hypothetical protein Agub_g3449 [Astrephomene gubernaculifera]
MEAAAGAPMRPRLAQVGHTHRRCANSFQRIPPSFIVSRNLARSLHSAAGPGPGSSSDAGDALAPILFRFGDSPTSPTISGKSSQSQSSSRSNIFAGSGSSASLTGGSISPGGTASISGGGISGLAPPSAVAASAGLAPLEAPPRPATSTSSSSGGSSSNTSISKATPSRLSRDTSASSSETANSATASTSTKSTISSSNSASYSEYYRMNNTPFQRPPAAGTPSSPSSSTTTTTTTDAALPKVASTGADSRSPTSIPAAAKVSEPSQASSSERAAPTATAADAAAQATTTTPTPTPTAAATDASTLTTSSIEEAPSSTTASSSSTTTATSAEAPDTPSSPSTSSTAPADDPQVAAAIARAQAALKRAENSLEGIERLSSSLEEVSMLRASAEPPSKWARLLSLARAAASLGALSVALLASHAFGLAVQWVGAVAGAAGIAAWGLQRRALAPSGAAAAFLVGCGTLGSSLRFGATLLAFFLSSSKLTSYKEEMKEGLEESARKGGMRDWVQVLCNGLVPTVLAVVYGILAGCVDLPLGPPISSIAPTIPTPPSAAAATATAAAAAAALATGPALEPWRAAALTALMGGFLGYYACCCGDTWASELGPLSADTPVLITSMRPVRRGTNGGVTLLGLSASIFGGMFVGLVFYLAGLLSPTLWIFSSQRALAAAQWRLIPLGLMAGLLGSGLDSLLGATLQFSGYHAASGRIVSAPGPGVERIAGRPLLSNNGVNALSASATAALTAFVALKTFGF